MQEIAAKTLFDRGFRIELVRAFLKRHTGLTHGTSVTSAS